MKMTKLNIETYIPEKIKNKLKKRGWNLNEYYEQVIIKETIRLIQKYEKKESADT